MTDAGNTRFSGPLDLSAAKDLINLRLKQPKVEQSNPPTYREDDIEKDNSRKAPSNASAEAEDDDGWGEWEEDEGDGVKDTRRESLSSTSPVRIVETVSDEADGADEIREGYTTEEGRYLPTQADFATKLTTQYGRTNISAASARAGVATTDLSSSSKTDLVIDPDYIDTDLDNVDDLSDEEPKATDTIVAQYVDVTKPGNKKVHSQGIWKIKAKNGIANIGGREFFFETLNANLDFQC